MRTFYTYRILGASSILDLPPTDLFQHRVRLKPNTPPWNKSKRKHWSVPQKYWLDKLVQEGIDAGMYEPCITANGELSDWAAQPVLVDKDRDAAEPDPWAEPRLTFNYRNVEEDVPGTNITLLSDVHEHLSHPGIGSYSIFDLKHGYWAIGIYPPHRHYFAFKIPDFPQLQPTRMPQGSQSAGFSFTELMTIALGPIPKPQPEPSMMAPESPSAIPPLTFYIDDVFATHSSFDEQWVFIRDHFLPRLLWAGLRLSFKKMQLGFDEVVAIGISHKTHGRLGIKTERANKLRIWPVPQDQTGVRAFLGALGPTRRWIKNCAEIARPLNRLTGDVEWRWDKTEALSFELLRELSSTAVDMHGHAFDLPVEMYSDASGFAGGCLITQKQEGVVKPLIYDSFVFTKTQRNYGTYKRELCAILEFCRRHGHLFKARTPSVIYTDHKPLVWFIDSPNVEGIYARWASELRLLNARICYIEGTRNKIADALSRTIFPDDDCENDVLIHDLGDLSSQGEWVWKDGVSGYAEMLEKLSQSERLSKIDHLFEHSVKSSLVTLESSWAWSDSPDGFQSLLDGNPLLFESSDVSPVTLCSSRTLWESDNWYADIYGMLKNGVIDHTDRMRKRVLLNKARQYRLRNDVLEQLYKGVWRRCLCKSEVSAALHKAHDKAGHFSPAITIQRLNQSVFWPGMAKDTIDYIAGCLPCGYHGPAKPPAPSQPVTVHAPLQLMAGDFVGPFPASERGFRYLLVIVCYFSHYDWAFPTTSVSAEEAIRCFDEWINMIGTSPLALYLDPGEAFISRKLHNHLHRRGVAVLNGPSSSHRSFGLAEVFIRITQQVLGKTVSPIPIETPSGLEQWDTEIPQVMAKVNARHVQSLGWSPFEILHGHLPVSHFEQHYPPQEVGDLRSTLTSPDFLPPSDEQIRELVVRHMARLQHCHEHIRSDIEETRLNRKLVHDLRTSKVQTDGLVFLFQEGKRPKLGLRWTGPFIVGPRSGRSTFKLLQLDGKPASLYDYHENQLKPFIPRTGHLRSSTELTLPFWNLLRRKRTRS